MVDFAQLKERVTPAQAMHILGLTMRENPPGQFRGMCPACKSGGDRALSVHATRGFTCFSAHQSGDVISLVAHIKGVSAKDAAQFLEDSVKPVAKPKTVETREVFDAEKYASRLDPSHDALLSLGVTAETFRVFKAGYSNAGLHRGKLALPLHDRDGRCVGYFGRSLKDESPLFTFAIGHDPSAYIFGAHLVTSGELYIVRDPLQVLQAFENGTENVVAFLTDGIAAVQWEMLSSLMDTKQVEKSYLF